MTETNTTQTAEFLPIVGTVIGQTEQQTVDARKLHSFLEVKSRFNDWIQNRIKQFNFEPQQDFLTLTKNLVSGGESTEYFISIDMAKELSMVERNAKGKEARRYFINCERIAKEKTAAAFAIPQTLPEALRLAASLAEKNSALEYQAKIDAPKVDFFNTCGDTTGMYLGSEVASFLKIKRNFLFNWCYNRGITQRRNGKWCTMKSSRDKKWCFDVLKTGSNKATGDDYESNQLYFTPLGIRYIHGEMRKEGVQNVPEQLELFDKAS